MADLTLPDMTEKLALMMREKLGIRRGKTFAGKIRIGGRLLPRNLRREAKYLIDTQARTAHPKLQKQIDMTRARTAFKQIEKHLAAIDTADQWKGYILGIVAPLTFNFLLIFGALITYLVYTDQL
jgi:hypothetical protein